MSISDSFLDINEYEIQSKITESDFEKVFKVIEKETQQEYLAKVLLSKETSDNSIKISKTLYSGISKAEISNLSRNVDFLTDLHHPSILQFIGCSLTDFNKQSNLVLITEFPINSTLRSILSFQKQYSALSTWNDTKKLINIYGIASGMSYLHSHDIIHGELNSKNILMDEYLCPKIDNYYASKLNQQKLKQNKLTKADDVYLFSLIVYEILTNEVPSQNQNLILSNSLPKCYQKLINDCSSKDPNKRPTFDDIIEALETDSNFITEDMEKNDYFDYIQFIDKYLKTIDLSQTIIQLRDYVSPTSTTYIEVNINPQTYQQPENYKTKSLFPDNAFGSLEINCQKLVQEADDGDFEKQFLVGKSIFEGSNNFPQNDEIGINYLIQAIKGGSIESAFYFCQIILNGKLSQDYLNQAEIILAPFLNDENSTILTMVGKIKNKERNYNEAEKYFKKASDAGDGEAMFEYGKILFAKAKAYFEKSKQNGCSKSDLFLSENLKNNDEVSRHYQTSPKKEKYVEYEEIHRHRNEESQQYFNESTISKNTDFDSFRKSDFNLTKSEQLGVLKAKEIRYMKQVADDGDTDAMVNYGLALVKGEFIQKDLKAACHYFLKAANEGNPNGMMNYGLMLEHGNGIPINRRKACRYYKMAAEKGNIEAMNYYGLMLLNGEGVEVDQREASRYLKKLIREGKADSYSRLVLSTEDDPSFEATNKIKACQYFKVAADKGNIEAMLNYGIMVSKGDGVPINKEEACHYFKVAADNGNTEAMLTYSSMLLKGEGTKVDKNESCRYCKMAAERGNFKAIYNYGMMLYKGEGTKVNKHEACKYLKMAAERGNADAMLQYGLMLSKGEGVPVNKEAACYYFQLSAAKRNTEAMRNLGLMLSKGEGIEMDKKKACYFLKKAADRGNVEAMLNYGLMTKDGEGVPVCKKDACKYFKMSADNGNDRAMLNYGLMLLNGEGVPIDKKKACHYIKLAAYKGNPKAMLQYALLLDNGEGVQMNKEEAQCYYKMAADKGSIDARVYYNMSYEESKNTQ